MSDILGDFQHWAPLCGKQDIRENVRNHIQNWKSLEHTVVLLWIAIDLKSKVLTVE